MTAAVPSPDLQRIVEALQACRERFELRLGIRFGTHHVWDLGDDVSVCNGTRSECFAYIDARCAEAMVRAIREPSQATIEAGWLKNICTSDQVWRAMCDAILGETQP